MTQSSRQLTLRRMDAILALLRKGDRTVHEIADLVCLIPEQVRARYLKVLITEGRAHISRAVVREGAGSKSPRAIFAYGPPPEGVEHNYGAQFARAREAIGTGTYLAQTLTPILVALEDGEKELAEIATVTGFHLRNIKRRLDHLIDEDRIHVADREVRDGYPKFLYALGPAPKAMPRGATKQYNYWRKRYADVARKADNARRRALYRRTPDIAAAWIPRRTTNTEIRA